MTVYAEFLVDIVKLLYQLSNPPNPGFIIIYNIRSLLLSLSIKSYVQHNCEQKTLVNL